MMRRLQLVLACLIAGFFLWLTLRDISFAELSVAFIGLTYGWLGIGIVFLAAGYLLRTLRWKMMLLPHNQGLTTARVGVALVGSIAVNNLLPFRAGDVLRCFGFVRWLGIPSGSVTATVLVERLLDMVTLILALATALWLLQVDGAHLSFGQATSATLAAIGLLCVGLFLWPQLLAPLFRGLETLAGRQSDSLKNRVQRFVEPLLDTLMRLSRNKATPALICLSVLAWGFEGATYWAIAQAVPELTSPSAAWLAMPVGTLSTLLPSTPGHVGTFDYFARLAMTAAENPLVGATAFVLVTHALLWLTTTLTGAACLLYWQFTRGNGAEP